MALLSETVETDCMYKLKIIIRFSKICNMLKEFEATICEITLKMLEIFSLIRKLSDILLYDVKNVRLPISIIYGNVIKIHAMLI